MVDFINILHLYITTVTILNGTANFKHATMQGCQNALAYYGATVNNGSKMFIKLALGEADGIGRKKMTEVVSTDHTSLLTQRMYNKCLDNWV